jgi:hypothetical protein
MKYVPPFEVLRRMVTIGVVKGVTQVSAPYEDFLKLLRTLISVIEIDEGWYLRQYDDVALAIRSGTVQSAQQHFAVYGFFEGRLPFQITIDEEWYLAANPDVAENVRKGIIPSGQAHFDAAGYREGRLPSYSTALAIN